MTSHDVVQRVRRILQQKKVGHTGTLDPAARGVLPICLGQATRLAEYVQGGRKTYLAEIRFGKETDTYDCEGSVVGIQEAGHLTLQEIESLLPRFMGDQQQVPPMFSAIKIKGKKLYELGRQGMVVQRPPRAIHIDALEPIEWKAGTFPLLKLRVSCSAGTYIRSLAHDLGVAAGTGAHLECLIRQRAGEFDLETSWSLDSLETWVLNHPGPEEEQPWLLPLDWPIRSWPSAHLDAVQVQNVLHGRQPGGRLHFDRMVQGHRWVRLHHPDGRFLAVAEVCSVTAETAEVALRKVFP